ncbi:MAG: hypothetical protein ABFD60_10095 [Bryobacteraceae bacterium]
MGALLPHEFVSFERGGYDGVSGFLIGSSVFHPDHFSQATEVYTASIGRMCRKSNDIFDWITNGYVDLRSEQYSPCTQVLRFPSARGGLKALPDNNQRKLQLEAFTFSLLNHRAILI